MYRPLTIEATIEMFALDSEWMTRRAEVGNYIHSFSAMIAERLYNHYLLKDGTFHNFLTSTDVPRLMRMFGEYFSSLFIHPIDGRMFERTRQIGDIHIGIGMSSAQLSRGFDIVSEIVIDLAGVNTQIRDDLAIILKMIRISELIMRESYRELYLEYNEEMKKENEVLGLFDKLFTSLNIHKQSQKKVIHFYSEHQNIHRSINEKMGLFHDEISCPFSLLIEELVPQKELLESLGIDLDEIHSLHHRYHEKLDELLQSDGEEVDTLFQEVESISKELYTVIDTPLSDISTTSFLGVHSGIEFLQACTHSIHDRGMGDEIHGGKIYEHLYQILERALGWCIEEIYVGRETPSEMIAYDINRDITLKDERIHIAVKIKTIPNKTYMIEIIKILLEVVKQNLKNKERENALIQLVDQVERASQSKDMFLANMSHELRTPLNAIIGFSQILGMNQTLPQNLKPYIEKIGIAGNNLLTLVNTILDFAKLEAGKLTFKPEVTIISGLLRDVASIIEPIALKKNIHFRYSEMISLGLYLDRQLIHQVLLNLLSNAVKFTPEGGEVIMSVDFDEEKRVYRFGICDTGIGIEAKDIVTLFDPFTQVENPFQKSSKGTGLGLAISKRIVEDLHGGRLWVESEPGSGACFYFTIPVSQTQNTLERFVAPNEYAKRMLIVEDAPEYQKMLIDRLSESYHLVVTNSVNKAKELLEKEQYDFIVLDFFLVDGISSEVLQFMEQNRVEIPVIIISAEDDSKLISHLPNTESVEGIFNKANIQEICDYLTKRI
ncbi:MAG: ATP-binding protein [Sulfuricurvum sp.]|nr:ATP-binding protein [Sulfuricurvum sp.]